jgi:2-amino-4-hydroxy-6-hydroxymethyldihydropteridine diphosphokinase
MLDSSAHVSVTAVSSLYKTPPWGKTDQPDFLNGAALIETDLDGPALLRVCQHIETSLGRVRHEKWGARTIDIDLVYSPDVTYDTDVLKLPHPYMTERAFVLIPVRDIAPELIINGKAIGMWLQGLDDIETIQKYAEPVDWFRKEFTYGKNTDCR